jgi:GTP-binding protein
MADIVEDDLLARGLEVYRISAASHEGLKELSYAMARVVARARAERPEAEPTRIVLRPAATSGNGDDFTVTPTSDSSAPSGTAWVVRGVKPERWIRQTDFSNDEAVGFLADRLNALGVEAKLVDMGACEGDPVVIGHPDNAVVFDFKPGLDAGAEILGRRGEDNRFTEERPAASRRRAIDERMGERAETETRADVARRIDGRAPEATDETPTWENDL